MNTVNRRRAAFLLIVALFAAPIVVAYVLNAVGWRPAKMRNYGELVEPAQDLRSAALPLRNGGTFAWKDAEWHWTLVAVAGPDCARACLAKLDELHRARLTLNQNAARLRLLAVDADVPADAAEALKPFAFASDPQHALAALRPAAPDTVAAAVVDPNGYLILRYAAGYDGNGLRKDLIRAVK